MYSKILMKSLRNELLYVVILLIFIKNSHSVNDTKSITTQCSYGYNGNYCDGIKTFFKH